MSPWVWIFLGIVLGIIEMTSTTFVILWIAVAALLTGITGFVMHNFVEQVIIFAILSIILLIVTRPLAKRYKKRGSKYSSNVEQLVGEKGIVISKVAAGKTGMVRVGSDMWSARGEDAAESMEVGEWVQVKAVHSSILIVGKL